MLSEIGAERCVTAFLHPGAHLIVYPVRDGEPSTSSPSHRATVLPTGWSGKAETADLAQCFARSSDGIDSTARSRPGRGPYGRSIPSMLQGHGPARADRADRRRRPCDDAVCGARCGNGDRGRGDAWRRQSRMRGTIQRMHLLGGKWTAVRASNASRGAAQSTASPGMRAVRSRWRATFSSKRARRSARRRHRLALRLEAGRIASIVQRQRQRQCLRQRVPPTGPQPGFAQSPGGPGVATEQRVE